MLVFSIRPFADCPEPLQKRKRRDYRLARKAQFTRPDPGFSLYEGRTRGKRMKYTYSDEEDGGSDALSMRRSNRQSGVSTPAETSGPTFTASGRQVRSRHGGAYGESMVAGQGDAPRRSTLGGMDGAEGGNDEQQPRSYGRSGRTARHMDAKSRAHTRKHIEGYNSLDSMEDESDATSSGGDWDGGDDEEVDDKAGDEDDDDDLEMSDDDGKAIDEEEEPRSSLVVSLRYVKSRSKLPPEPIQQEPQHPTVPSAATFDPGKGQASYATIPAVAPVDSGVTGRPQDKPSQSSNLETSSTEKIE